MRKPSPKPWTAKYALRTDQDGRQLDLQSLHRVRERWVGRRTAVINQIRGMMLERGITVRKGRHYLEESLPGILEDPENTLSGAMRVLLAQLQLEMQYLQRQIEESDKLILRIASELEPCRRLVAIPGIGPVIATATTAATAAPAASFSLPMLTLLRIVALQTSFDGTTGFVAN
jgi:transposase